MTPAGPLACKRALRFPAAIAFYIASLLSTPAHGPFDNSAQVIVHDDTIEAVVTMGMDGARQFLMLAGLSDSDVATALSGRGPSTVGRLPEHLAPRFFEAVAAEKPLVAQRASVMTDGLEAAFTIVYPRPVGVDFRFHALYFNGIERMKPGSFIATDENRNLLVAAMLSRAKPAVEIKHPTIATPSPDMVEATKPDSPAPSIVTVAANSEKSLGKSSIVSPICIWIAVLGLVAIIFRIVARKLPPRGRTSGRE